MDLLLSLYEDERVQLAQSTRHRRAPFGRSSPARGSRSWVGLFSCVRTWSRDTYGVARSATHKNNSPRTADGGLKEGWESQSVGFGVTGQLNCVGLRAGQSGEG